MNQDTGYKVVRGYGIPGLPFHKLTDGRWVCTTNDIAINARCSANTVLQVAHRRKDRFKTLNMTNCHVYNAAEKFGVSGRGRPARLWTLIDAIRLINHIHNKHTANVQDAMYAELERTMQEEFVPREVVDRMRTEHDAQMEQQGQQLSQEHTLRVAAEEQVVQMAGPIKEELASLRNEVREEKRLREFASQERMERKRALREGKTYIPVVGTN